MIDYTDFSDHITNTQLSPHLDSIKKFIEIAFINNDIVKWQNAIDSLPDISPSIIDLNRSVILIGAKKDCSYKERVELKNKLMKLHPWR